MKLFTINATPVRYDDSNNTIDKKCKEYPSQVAEILASYGIEGFTIYQVSGYWQGSPEISFKIEIATDKLPEGLAEELRDKYNQDAVMVTSPDNSVDFI